MLDVLKLFPDKLNFILLKAKPPLLCHTNKFRDILWFHRYIKINWCQIQSRRKILTNDICWNLMYNWNLKFSIVREIIQFPITNRELPFFSIWFFISSEILKLLLIQDVTADASEESIATVILSIKDSWVW